MKIIIKALFFFVFVIAITSFEGKEPSALQVPKNEISKLDKKINKQKTKKILQVAQTRPKLREGRLNHRKTARKATQSTMRRDHMTKKESKSSLATKGKDLLKDAQGTNQLQKKIETLEEIIKGKDKELAALKDASLAEKTFKGEKDSVLYESAQNELKKAQEKIGLLEESVSNFEITKSQLTINLELVQKELKELLDSQNISKAVHEKNNLLTIENSKMKASMKEVVNLRKQIKSLTETIQKTIDEQREASKKMLTELQEKFQKLLIEKEEKIENDKKKIQDNFQKERKELESMIKELSEKKGTDIKEYQTQSAANELRLKELNEKVLQLEKEKKGIEQLKSEILLLKSEKNSSDEITALKEKEVIRLQEEIARLKKSENINKTVIERNTELEKENKLLKQSEEKSTKELLQAREEIKNFNVWDAMKINKLAAAIRDKSLDLFNEKRGFKDDKIKNALKNIGEATYIYSK